MLKTQKINGFTLIELIATMVIVGILAVAAIPRFFSYTQDAQAASLKATVGSFTAAVHLIHAGWIAGGAHSGVNSVLGEGNYTVYLTDTGWPVGFNNARNDINAGLCSTNFNGIMVNPPSITADVGQKDTHDYFASVDAGATICTYTLNNTNDTMYFTYNIITIP